MKEIYASFVFAGRQRGRFENETVPVIRRSSCLTDVWPQLNGRALFDELIVDKELYFHAPVPIIIVDRPPGNRLRVGMIQPATQARVRRRKVEGCGNRSDQQRFHDGLAD